MTGQEFIAALRGADSATVSNAIEGLAVRDRTEGYADLRLRCLAAGPEPMVGYAVTVTIDSTTPGRKPDSSRLADLLAAVEASPKPCVVVIQEEGPAPERGCHMGDVVGTKLAQRGVVGIVSGSAIRDVDGIRELGLTAFALGTVVSHGVWTISRVGVDVEVAGLRVKPGDLLHGNGDGLVSVPDGQPGELLRLIAEVQAKEAQSKGQAPAAAAEVVH
jgi:4-hydroxy-4-methyl-2-oxoglutarate aldolase